MPQQRRMRVGKKNTPASPLHQGAFRCSLLVAGRWRNAPVGVCRRKGGFNEAAKGKTPSIPLDRGTRTMFLPLGEVAGADGGQFGLIA